jgi:hypothetical protein
MNCVFKRQQPRLQGGGAEGSARAESTSGAEAQAWVSVITACWQLFRPFWHAMWCNQSLVSTCVLGGGGNLL